MTVEQLGLWIEAPAPSRPTSSGRKRWGGRDSERARAHCRTLLPCPCQRCGVLITPDDPEDTWHAGHIIDRMDTDMPGEEARPDPTATVPEHARCNTSAGGKRGAAITNAARAREDVARERTTRWW